MSGLSSACRSRHHKDCRGTRLADGKRVPCECECHAKARKRPREGQEKSKKSERKGVRAPRAIIGPDPRKPTREEAIQAWQTTPPPEPPIEEMVTPERPICFGNCCELSSACDACPEYNTCRRETK